MVRVKLAKASQRHKTVHIQIFSTLPTQFGHRIGWIELQPNHTIPDGTIIHTHTKRIQCTSILQLIQANKATRLSVWVDSCILIFFFFLAIDKKTDRDRERDSRCCFSYVFIHHPLIQYLPIQTRALLWHYISCRLVGSRALQSQ